VFSKEYLGYLAYIYFVILLYFLYKINFSYIDRVIEKTISLSILALSFIVLQALTIEGSMSGKIGVYIVDYLNPLIGLTGLWIVFLIGFVISLFVLLESSSELISQKVSDIKTSFLNFFKISFPKTKIKEPPRKLERAKGNKEQKVIIEEVGDTAEIKIEEVEDTAEIKIEKVEETQMRLVIMSSNNLIKYLNRSKLK